MNSTLNLLDLIFSNANQFWVGAPRDVVTLPASDSYALDAATVALSFEADDVTGTQGLFSRDAMRDAGDGYHVSLYIKKGELIARFQNDDGQVLLNAGEVEAGTAYHTAITFGDGMVGLSLNGEVVDSRAFDFTWETSPEVMQFGALGWKSASGGSDVQSVFDGSISDVEVYGSALTMDQVAEIAGDAGQTPPQAEPPIDESPSNVVYGVEELELTRKKDATVLEASEAYALEAATVALAFEADDVDGTKGLFSRDASNDAGDGYHVSLYIKKGELIARFQNEDGQVYLNGGSVQTGNVYHTAITFGDGTVGLLVNGQFVEQKTFDFTWETSPEAIQIGALGWRSASGSSDVQNVFDGTLTNVEIYDSALGESQIAELSEAAGAEDAPVGQGQSAFDPIEEPDAPAEDPPAEDPPAEDPPAEDPPAEDPPAEDPPAEDPPAEDPPAEDPPAEDPPAEDPPAEDPPAEDPPAEDPPAPPPEDPAEPLPDPVASDGSGENGTVISLGGNTQVMTGRTSTLEHDDGNIASIRILDKPDLGNLTVNPDNTMALVLSNTNETGNISFSYEVTYDDGSSETVSKSVNVIAGTQAKGWGDGDYYELEKGDDNAYVVEHGDNHRAVHISGSNDALSLNDIAAIEGISANSINIEWFAENPEYGADPSMALDEEAGMRMWRAVTPDGSVSSNHLLFERGYEYDNVREILGRDFAGESELHPLYIGAYGEGEKPIIHSPMRQINDEASNVVIQGLEVPGGVQILQTVNNLVFDDMVFSNNEETALVVKDSVGVTIRNSDFYEIVRETSNTESRGDWEANANRISGIFAARNDGLLVEDLFLDHVGWADDYQADLGLDGGQPPSIFSHNIYISEKNEDVTLRDTITMRSSSFGAMVRGGGLIEDTLFLDNNAALTVLGGDAYDAGPVGFYSLLNGNVVTSGAHKVHDGPSGALTWGLHNYGMDTSLVGNIVTHLTDPDDPDDIDDKYKGQKAIANGEDPYFDDSIIYRWFGGRDLPDWEANKPNANVEGLDESTLDETTIQRFAADLLNQEIATIDDLGEYLRAQSEAGEIDRLTADEIIAYFENGFGLAEETTEEPRLLRFVPDDRGEGTRWDNELNWDYEAKPEDGDSVDLAGNWVHFGGTVELDNLDFGDGSELYVHQGKLSALDMESDGNAKLSIDQAGQLWTDGFDDEDVLDIDIDGGRFANTGKFAGAFDMTVTDGQALLGVDSAEMVISEGSTLRVEGSDAKVGFEGEVGRVSVLEMDGGRLEMVADNDGFSGIEEVRSGAMGDSPNVLSAFDMGEGTLLLDVTALSGQQVNETLIEVDEMVGMFDDIELVGLSNNQDATLTFDYEVDTVTLSLSAAGQGSGAINLAVEGDSGSADIESIWDVLTDGQGTYEEIDTTVDVNEEEDVDLVA